ncbi:hypothetical protein GBAR_LOCUS1229, partial [Geodia barretti]
MAYLPIWTVPSSQSSHITTLALIQTHYSDSTNSYTTGIADNM